MTTDVFTALSDPTRRAILKLLRSGDLTAGEITDRFPLARSTLSGHFTVLKEAGLIVAERHGTTIVYSANVSAIEEALGVVIGLLGSRSKRGVSHEDHLEDRAPAARDHRPHVRVVAALVARGSRPAAGPLRSERRS
jgi:DNA-binding transcriptional ArsR family regulator